MAAEIFGVNRVGIGTVEEIAAKVHIKVAVLVIIEENGVGAIAGIRQPVFNCLLFEGEVVLVYEKEVLGGVQKVLPEGADIDIVIPIPVNIHYADPCGPNIGGEACLFGDILERVVPLIDIEPATGLVPGEKNVFLPVPVEVPDANAPAHIAELVYKGAG
jgi:hypothetical protein